MEFNNLIIQFGGGTVGTKTLPHAYSQYYSVVFNRIGTTGNTSSTVVNWVVNVSAVNTKTLTSFNIGNPGVGCPTTASWIAIGF